MVFFRFNLTTVLCILLIGCQSSDVWLTAIGKESEVLVVCRNEVIEAVTAKAVLAELSSDYPALPQQETLFDVTCINESDFSELFRRHKAILKIEPTSEETKMYVKRNQFANQQVILLLKINENQLNDPHAGHQLGLAAADFFIKEDRKNRIEKLKNAYSKINSEAVIRSTGLKLTVPEDFFIAKEEKNFIWLRRETSNTSSAILIYKIPVMPDLNPVALRDSVTKIHIPGPSDGSFMKVNKELEPVVFSDSLLNQPAIVTRGIWKVENDFMGGPFVNFCIPDPARNRIICMDAFVYAPKFDKREYLNKLIAIIYSAEPVKEN